MNPIQYLEKRIATIDYRKQYALERIKIRDGKTKISVRFLDGRYYKLKEEKIGTVAKWEDYIDELNGEIRQYKKAIKILKQHTWK